MTFTSGNPYKIAAIQKAKRLKEEKISLEKWNNLTEKEQEEKTLESKTSDFLSERKDTHSMQYSFYSKNK